MCGRIIIAAFLSLSFMCLSVNGQTAIVYSYDSAGNRTSRATVEAADVASVPSEMSVDASDRLKCSLPVSKGPGNIASLASGEAEGETDNTSLMWRFDFLENRRPMNEYARGIGKYGRMSLSRTDFYKRNWMGNEELL